MDTGKSSNINPFLSPQQKLEQSDPFLSHFASNKPQEINPGGVVAAPVVGISVQNLTAAEVETNIFQQPKITFPIEDTEPKIPVNPFTVVSEHNNDGEGFLNPFFKTQKKEAQQQQLYFHSKQDSVNDNGKNLWQKQVVNEKPSLIQQKSLFDGGRTSINPFLQKSITNTTVAGIDNIDKSDTRSLYAIKLHDVPKKYFAEEFIMPFYSKFGTVIKVELKPFPTKTAVVKFVNRDDAKRAMEEGRVFADGEPPIEMTWESLLTSSSSLPRKQVNTRQSKKIVQKPRQSLDDFKSILRSYAQNLSNICCATSREKYELLDKLDKKIREGLHRDSKEYKALVGTCLEMCPEKERYFRDDKCQCSFFEIKDTDQSQEMGGDPDSVLDPLKAVKEYSRSSADQEVPLPHELRHISALKQTMEYLIANLVNIEHATIPEWFDFLWNRTRAIRKDITQQNLKCMTSIDCVEKCARFHIFCSHYLCEQEMHIFDAKINLENLTKCLQTLKHMYGDYWRDHKTTCPNEVEFRGYQILLNLNNGDTLREVMAFSDEIRKSEPVKFALQVFSAVQENNYSRFFKLLQKSSFLNSCLMHPYFTQIRATALKRMARAFSVPKSDTPYPIQHIQNIFVFDDMETTAEFCKHFGFETDNFDVFLNRTSYINPDEHFAKRLSKVISMKCETSMAEVINGGSLTFPVNYVPVNSFTRDGYYIGNYQELEGVPDLAVDNVVEPVQIATAAEMKDDPDFIRDEDEGSEEEEEEEEVEDNFTKGVDYTDGSFLQQIRPIERLEESVERPVMILREDIVNFSLVLVDELISDVTIGTFNEILMQLKETLGEVDWHVNNFIANFCLTEMNTLCREVLQEVKEDEKREGKELMRHVADDLCSNYVNEVIDSLLGDISTKVYTEARQIEDEFVVQRESEALQRFLIDYTLVEMINDIAVDVHDSVVEEKKESLMSQKKQLQTRILKRYFQRWIKSYKYYIFVKTTLAEFPQCPPTFPLKEAIDRLNIRDHDEVPQHLDICADVSWLDNERNFKRKLSAFHAKYQKLRSALSEPMKLKETFEKAFVSIPHHHVKANSRNKFCRIRITIPTELQLKTGQTVLTPNILVKKFSNVSNDDEETLKEHKDKIIYRDCINCNTRGFVHISIRCMCSGSPVRNTLMATSCLVFVVQLHSNNDEQHWEKEHKRLTDILKTNSHRNNTNLLVLGIADDVHSLYGPERLAAELYLENIKMDNLVSVYHCVILKKNISSEEDVKRLDTELENALEDILQCCELQTERIISKELSSFVEDGMTKLFFNTFQRYCLHCKKIGLPIPNPMDVVMFYNNTIEEVANSISDFSFHTNEDTQDEETPGEDTFDRRTKGMYDLVMGLKLPEFPEDYSKSEHEKCVEYIQLLGGADSAGLVNRVNTVLQQFTTPGRNYDPDLFPWADVLELCIMHTLSIMYVKSSQEPAFTSRVHYQENMWNSLAVENPLKRHMNSFNVSLRSLNESGTNLKRRKYEREYNLRDSIETTSDELSSIEDSMRKRKARRLSQKQSSPLRDLLNESRALVQGIHSTKKNQFGDRLSFSPIERCVPVVIKKSSVSSSNKSSARFDDSTEKLLERSVALEDSLVECLKQIDDANLEWRSRKEYWEKIINQ